MIPKQIYTFLRDNHKCQSCGKCCYCSPIAIFPKDIRVLACKLGMSVKDFKKQYTEAYPGVKGLSHFKKENPCAFLENNRCTVYDARPEVCRQYPLMKGKRIPNECEVLNKLVGELIDKDGKISPQMLFKAIMGRKLQEEGDR